MRLSDDDAAQFFRIHHALMCYVNQRLKVVPVAAPAPADYARLPAEDRLKVHDAFRDHLDLIEDFAAENPCGLDDEDLEIARAWKHAVSGTFYALRPLRNYMVFLSAANDSVAYGVLALMQPFAYVIGTDFPIMLRTTLLPFKGKIVYDGIVSGYQIHLGPGIRRILEEGYKKAKARLGIVTSLPLARLETRMAKPRAKTTPKQPTAKARSASRSPRTPGAGTSARDQVVALTDAFCRTYLNEEYVGPCRELAGILARKRPSPLTRGKPESWASGIVRAVGWANFIDDPSQPDHIKLSEIDARIGVSEATGSAKSMLIRKLLRIRRFDPEWTVPSKVDQNPMAWMIEVNGIPIDARYTPREIQEAAYRKGLIPYLPSPAPGAADNDPDD